MTAIQAIPETWLAEWLGSLNALSSSGPEKQDAPKALMQPQGGELPDGQVIQRIRASKQAEKFAALYDHGDLSDYGEDQSRADLALMDVIGWACGWHRDQMERIFSEGELGQREKWIERADYRRLTVLKACTKDATSQPSAPAPRLPIVTLDNLESARLDPVQHVVECILPRRTVTLLGGHGAAGKTYLALVIAAHVAAGVDWAGLAVVQERVVFGSFEDEPDVLRLRARRIGEHYRLDTDAIARNMVILDGSQMDATLWAEGASYGAPAGPTALLPVLAESVRGAGLIFIDGASDTYGANENHRRDVRGFMRALASIARTEDAAVALLAHIDKNAAKFGPNANSYSGSTAWHNSARSRLALLTENGKLTLVHEKANHSEKIEPIELVRNADGVPVPADTLPEIKLLETEERTQLVAAFKAAADADVNVPPKLTPGAHSAMATLATFEEYPPHFGTSGAKGRDAARVLMAMLREGAIVKEQYTTDQRKKKTRLVLAECANTQPQEGDGEPEECAE